MGRLCRTRGDGNVPYRSMRNATGGLGTRGACGVRPLMNKSRPTPVTGEKLAEVTMLHGDPEELPLAEEPTSVIIKNDLDAVAELAQAHDEIMAEINKRIIGQRRVVEQLLVALFARGHTLFVGVPGLAKTLLISTLAETLNLTFQRIQFTPDLMPAD